MTNGRQTSVSSAPARGIPGDPASMNPVFSVDAGPFGLVAGPAGCIIGRFGWAVAPADGDGAPSVVNNTGAGAPTGFVRAQMQGTITQYLADAGMTIIAGQAMDLVNGTDFWATNADSIQAMPGGTVYARLADGAILAQSGTAVATGTIAAKTATITGGIFNDTLVVTAASGDPIAPGTVLSGSGVATGTMVQSQLLPLLSGEAAGGIGRYAVSIPEQNVAAATSITGTYGLFTAVSGLTGSFSIGSVLSGSGVTANTRITAFGTGIGGLGTYYVTPSQTAGSTAITGTTTVDSGWKFASAALAGELVKIRHIG